MSKLNQGNHINLIELQSPMFHDMFQNHRTFVSGEEYFLRFFTICWRGGNLSHVT